ncbi:hypothetical protein Mp_8g14960 [Marchantia polymorpha subsp. ruderalis]|uniref:Sodium/calcium exchanger membrane region domain-containing protein n=1 Tax=Marchantia polymorpha TaxID=3197 RepID=A0A2R6W4Z9_MARPO|nr:hypothetical protein MARPO_0151s0010 [Marchantia polymorpha]BBN19931.1 hypothetical protein Mp_8g14960 [Marchantia polymorpha subsp. ruderalis]|eukprot:PTQ28933.1 hypothetical protein MARPO_0151s0010 [Marchantia polymorpha]
MRNLWVRKIRPAFVLASFIIFFVLVRPQDHRPAGAFTAEERPGHLRRSLLTKGYSAGVDGAEALQGYDQSKRLTNFRNLLTTSGDDNGVEVGSTEASSSVSVNGGQVAQISSRNESIGVASESDLELTPQRTPCENVREHLGYPDSCSYVKSIPQCKSGTLIEYTQFFFCTFKDAVVPAYIALAIWLVILFYMLGNQAADFFCCSIEKLSALLHLPPTVAGVTLLPLGNGAPDVFASIAAFVGAGQGQVGLNSVLGGATFVTSVVAGSASLVVAASNAPVHLDRRCFLRDIGFFLFTLAVLTTILFNGEIHFWGAIGYISIYGAYAVTVAAVEFLKSHRHKLANWQPLGNWQPLQPLLQVETTLPQWAWAPHVAIYSTTSNLQEELDRADAGGERTLWGNHEAQVARDVKWYSAQGLCSYIIEWPLTLPRRLTTPLVEEARWSKFYAVSSAALAPSLLAMVWDGKDSGPFGSAWIEYVVAGGIGLVLGGLAFFTTVREHPPRRYLFPWALGGFIMSIVWFYIIANELVGALVALGVVLEIDAAILGLTVLAWGNSIGDLMSNLALVVHGGDGVQIAFSGCYAGPMFNTLMGIGLSLVLASWKSYPDKFVIPQDPSIFFTLAFLVAGLVWAFIILPSRRMQPTKGFGIGLLALYAAFLTLRLALALGLSVFLNDLFNLNS